MSFDFSSVDELFEIAKEKKLYEDLIRQLQKDFDLANVDIVISNAIESEALLQIVREKTYFLILEKFDVYLNLLYVIDVPQKEFKNIHLTDAVDVADQMTFLMLKRELKKVWYKKKYTS